MLFHFCVDFCPVSDLFTNVTTHKVTLTITDGIATLCRVDTHKGTDRNP